MGLDPRTKCYWEEGAWPVVFANTAPFDIQREVAAKNFEDIRKRIFVIENPNVGSQGELTPFSASNWEGNWTAYDAQNPARPGQLVVAYRDSEGEIDYYVNNSQMVSGQIDSNPPLKIDGMLNSGWRLAPHPNRYHHYDHNAGKLTIGADGRWRIIYHEEVLICEQTEYTCREKVYKWLPRQVDPYRQIEPLKQGGNITRRHQGLELQKVFITRNLATTHERSLNTTGYETCKRPRRLTEYVLEFAEPSWVGAVDEECENSGQCHKDPKLNEAYQDRVIRTCEEQGFRFLKAVNEEWIENWLSVQTPLLWELGYYYWQAGQIVYKNTAEDAVLYVCHTVHTATEDNEPGVGGEWEEYWATPQYNPTWVVSQPMYVEMCGTTNIGPELSFSWLWGCNDSAFELLLKCLGGSESVYPAWSSQHGRYNTDDVVQYGDICRRCKSGHDSEEVLAPDNDNYWGEVTQFDWWWDTAHPAVPIWLYKHQFDDHPEWWPLPRGCWRRTWKHSAGRLGSLMWPGECGDPPGYQGLKLIVSAAAYAGIPEENRRWYCISNVEQLHAAAYGEEEEALIAKRHDPAHIRWIEYINESTGQTEWAGHPVYEMHHDLVNDLRNVLLQLHLVDSYGLTPSAGTAYQLVGAGEETGATSLGTYLEMIARCLAVNPPTYVNVPQGEFDGGGFSAQVSYRTVPPWYGIVSKAWFYSGFTVGGGEKPAVQITRPMIRIGYMGNTEHSAPWVWDCCEFGFAGLTIFPAKSAPMRYAYVYTTIAPDSDPETEWFFDAVINSPWPDTTEGGFFDYPDPVGDVDLLWSRETPIKPWPMNVHQWCVLDYDWDLVPEEVWAEDLTNAIEI